MQERKHQNQTNVGSKCDECTKENRRQIKTDRIRTQQIREFCYIQTVNARVEKKKQRIGRVFVCIYMEG